MGPRNHRRVAELRWARGLQYQVRRELRGWSELRLRRGLRVSRRLGVRRKLGVRVERRPLLVLGVEFGGWLVVRRGIEWQLRLGQ